MKFLPLSSLLNVVTFTLASWQQASPPPVDVFQYLRRVCHPGLTDHVLSVLHLHSSFFFWSVILFVVVLAVTLMSNVFSLSEDTTFTASVIAAQVPVIHSLTLSFFFFKHFHSWGHALKNMCLFLGIHLRHYCFLSHCFSLKTTVLPFLGYSHIFPYVCAANRCCSGIVEGPWYLYVFVIWPFF